MYVCVCVVHSKVFKISFINLNRMCLHVYRCMCVNALRLCEDTTHIRQMWHNKQNNNVNVRLNQYATHDHHAIHEMCVRFERAMGATVDNFFQRLFTFHLINRLVIKWATIDNCSGEIVWCERLLVEHNLNRQVAFDVYFVKFVWCFHFNKYISRRNIFYSLFETF